MGFVFVFNSILLGVGLAMDAFSVSLANGLNRPAMHKKKMCVIAGTFGFFQALMPMTGWVCVHTIIEYFKMFEKFIPWIALILLLFYWRANGEGRHSGWSRRSGKKRKLVHSLSWYRELQPQLMHCLLGLRLRSTIYHGAYVLSDYCSRDLCNQLYRFDSR